MLAKMPIENYIQELFFCSIDFRRQQAYSSKLAILIESK